MNKNLATRTGAGALTGAVNGIFGGGGGMIAVPVLKGMLGYDERTSHATAILLIAPVCAVSALVYILNGYFQPEVTIPAALGSVAGGMLGAKLLNVLPTTVINRLFLAVMFVAGARMLLP